MWTGFWLLTGTWKVTTPSALPGILGDTGLVVSSPAQHHAIFRPFQLDNTGKNLVLQFWEPSSA